MLSFSDKAKLFAINFSTKFNLDNSGISLPVFPSRTYLKLYKISIIPNMIKKSHNEPWFIKDICSWLYSSGGSKELWAWTFIHTSCVWKILVFQIIGRSHQWFLYLTILGKGLQLRLTALLFFFLWLVKSLKIL